MNVECIHQTGNVVARPEKLHLVANIIALQQHGKRSVFSRHTRAGKNTFEGKALVHRQPGQGSEEILVVLVGMPASDVSDNELAITYRPIPTEPRARPVVRLEHGQIVAIRYDRPVRARISCMDVAPRCILRATDNPSRDDTGYESAYPVHCPGRKGGRPRIQSAIVHPPKNRADAAKPRQDASDEVGVIHPALNHVRPIGREHAPERGEPLETQPSLWHRQAGERYFGRAKQRAIFSVTRKRDDKMGMAALGRAQAV